jgi:hypothetical protein
MNKLSNKDLLEKIREKLDKKETRRCNHIYEIKDKNKILSKLKKKDELYKNNGKIYARCSLKCDGQRPTCERHIEKESPDISSFIPLDYESYISKKEEELSEDSDDSLSSYEEECELIGRLNGIEYFSNSKEEIICINSNNYGEVVGKKGDKLWQKLGANHTPTLQHPKKIDGF